MDYAKLIEKVKTLPMSQCPATLGHLVERCLEVKCFREGGIESFVDQVIQKNKAKGQKAPNPEKIALKLGLGYSQLRPTKDDWHPNAVGNTVAVSIELLKELCSPMYSEHGTYNVVSVCGAGREAMEYVFPANESKEAIDLYEAVLKWPTVSKSALWNVGFTAV